MPEQVIVCDICGHTLGKTDPEEMYLPLLGKYFKSLDLKSGISAPFYDETEWINMKCRQCKKRPFLEPDRIKSLDGQTIIIQKLREKLKKERDQKVADMQEQPFLPDMKDAYVDERADDLPIVLKDGRYPCPKCPKDFISYPNMKKHYKAYHSND